MKGRKPTPHYLRLLRGNPQKKPIKPGLEAERPAKPPEAPAFLGPYAREAWDQLAGELHKLGCLTALDVAIFSVFCESHGRWRTAVEALNRMDKAPNGGLLIRGEGGQPAVNPLLGVIRRAADTMMKAGSKLGLSPAARSRINLPPQPMGPSKFDGLWGPREPA